MKSGFEFRPITSDDLPLLHIAVAQGVSLDPIVGGAQYLGWGPTEFGHAPIALMDVKETEYVIEPHVTWMPWATPRTRVGALRWALSTWDKVVFLIIAKEHNSLYEQFTKRRILRKVGVLHVQKEAGEEIHMYQKTGETG